MRLINPFENPVAYLMAFGWKQRQIVLAGQKPGWVDPETERVHESATKAVLVQTIRERNIYHAQGQELFSRFQSVGLAVHALIGNREPDEWLALADSLINPEVPADTRANMGKVMLMVSTEFGVLLQQMQDSPEDPPPA